VVDVKTDCFFGSAIVSKGTALALVLHACMHACNAESVMHTPPCCHRRTSWRCFLAAVCATFTLSQLSRNAQHGMIGFTGIRTYENKDWLTQLPFILINAGEHSSTSTSHACTWRLMQKLYSRATHILLAAVVVWQAVAGICPEALCPSFCQAMFLRTACVIVPTARVLSSLGCGAVGVLPQVLLASWVLHSTACGCGCGASVPARPATSCALERWARA
jgi:hypothetical protein